MPDPKREIPKAAARATRQRTRSLTRDTLRALGRHRSALVGISIIALFGLAAAIGPFVTPYDPLVGSFSEALQVPGPHHLLGTDELGRDVLSRILQGGRISLLVGLLSASLGMAIGIPLGAASGYIGGKTDLLVQRVVDIAMAFPGILLAIAVVNILGMGLWNVMIAIGISSVPTYTRLVRGAVMAIKEEDYVLAEKAIGAGWVRILFRHVLPNVLGIIVVRTSLQIAEAILWAGALGFLGLGAQAPTPEWGAMLSRGRAYMRVAPHLTLFPGLAIMLSVIGFNLLGDGLRDALDPRTRTR